MKKSTLVILLLASLTAVAQSYNIQHLRSGINTKGNETAPLVLDDSTLLYASHGIDELDLMTVVQTTLSNIQNSTFNIQHSKINSLTDHTGNIAYDRQHNRLFFTRCQYDEQGNIHCEIWTAKRDGTRWQRPHKLHGDINHSSYTSTQPTVAYMHDGNTLLYYVSDRPGGMGGMDVWYTVVRGDNAGSSANLGFPVNSPYNEITPFYDTIRGTLFFSSDRPDGMGGFDIYRTLGARNAWQAPSPLPTPFNSRFNDIYYTTAPSDTTWGFLASNREDSFFAIDSSCCNDIYRWAINIQKSTPNIPDTTYNIQNSTFNIQNSTFEIQHSTPIPTSICPCRFPIKLFFHNDEPNPRTTSDTTDQTYFQTYNRYMFLLPQYLAVYSGDTLQAHRVAAFFEEVRNHCDRFEELLRAMYADLKDGRNVAITITGYASTPHSDGYNIHLSSRRIASVINQIRQWRGGALQPYLLSGRLRIDRLPYGSRRSPDIAPDADPIYSVEMSRERRIEILDYKWF